MKIHSIDVSNMSYKNAVRVMKFSQSEYASQRALEKVDPEFAKEFSIDHETIDRLVILCNKKIKHPTLSSGPR